jgi:hypothetical protein
MLQALRPASASTTPQRQESAGSSQHLGRVETKSWLTAEQTYAAHNAHSGREHEVFCPKGASARELSGLASGATRGARVGADDILGMRLYDMHRPGAARVLGSRGDDVLTMRQSGVTARPQAIAAGQNGPLLGASLGLHERARQEGAGLIGVTPKECIVRHKALDRPLQVLRQPCFQWLLFVFPHPACPSLQLFIEQCCHAISSGMANFYFEV